jgi:hypothetical protein
MSNWLLRVEQKTIYTSFLEDFITIEQIREKYYNYLNRTK